MPATRPLIEIDRVGMTYRTDSGPVEALRDISLAVGDGEFVALVGPSGCGKSTLMRIIAGLRPVTSGRVVVDGSPVTGPVSRVGMVFQAAVLLKWRTVLDNVLLPAELSGQRPAKYRERALQLLELVGLADFAHKQPQELSGGMQQRASLCRALLLDPPILLMDEPFGALDAMTRDEMNLELLRIWGEGRLDAPGPAVHPGAAGGSGPHAAARKTIVFVTHSIPEAVFLADRVVVMTPRPGRVAGIHTVDIARPRTVQARALPAFGNLTLQIYQELAAAPGPRAAAAAALL
jgi:NitT/TauT family transport system ATP-binding protein